MRKLYITEKIGNQKPNSNPLLGNIFHLMFVFLIDLSKMSKLSARSLLEKIAKNSKQEMPANEHRHVIKVGGVNYLMTFSNKVKPMFTVQERAKERGWGVVFACRTADKQPTGFITWVSAPYRPY